MYVYIYIYMFEMRRQNKRRLVIVSFSPELASDKMSPIWWLSFHILLCRSWWGCNLVCDAFWEVWPSLYWVLDVTTGIYCFWFLVLFFLFLFFFFGSSFCLCFTLFCFIFECIVIFVAISYKFCVLFLYFLWLC